MSPTRGGMSPERASTGRRDHSVVAHDVERVLADTEVFGLGDKGCALSLVRYPVSPCWRQEHGRATLLRDFDYCLLSTNRTLRPDFCAMW
jgi:hypothetical protein